MDSVELGFWATIIGAFFLIVALTIGDMWQERKERK